MKSFFFAFLIFILVIAPLGVSDAHAALVTCGTGTAANPTAPPCGMCDLYAMINGILRFIVRQLAPLVAVILFLIAGFLMIISGPKPALFEQAKKMMTDTVIGLVIIYAAFLITNTILVALAGNSNASKDWFKIQCTYVEPYIETSIHPGGTGMEGQSCDDLSKLIEQYHTRPHQPGNAPELDAMIACIKSKLPGKDLGTIYTTDSIEQCNYSRGNTSCGRGSCHHAINSCHYGGATGSEGALAVDFGNETIGNDIINAANQCGAKSGGARCENSSGQGVNCNQGANHVHVTAAGCDRN